MIYDLHLARTYFDRVPISTGNRPFFRPGYENRPGYNQGNAGYPGYRPGYNQYRPGYNQPGYNQPGYQSNQGNYFSGYGDGYTDNFRSLGRKVGETKKDDDAAA